jgi:predicted lipoprotein with Yx(FWY)xxD motif
MKNRMGKFAVALALVSAAASAPLMAQGGTAAGTAAMTPAGVKVGSTSLGPTLVNDAGMTLYTFGSDSIPGKSVCNAQCATNWLPVAAAADAKDMGDWTIITRDDNTKQWAYKGKPLYTFKNDAKAGDTNGNGRGKWAVAKP